MKQISIKLTKAEIEQILSLISNNEENGYYYGNKKQYWNRSETIKTKLCEVLYRLSQNA